MAKQTPLEKAYSTLGALSRSELIKLRNMIDDLLDIIEEDQGENDGVDAANSKTKAGARGYIEHKMIRGFGPYAYLRKWKGKTLTSTYLGKAKS